MEKRKEEPIPADLMAMTLVQLQAESDSHDTGEIFKHRCKVAKQRDEAQAELERLSQRRADITRAIIAKLENH